MATRKQARRKPKAATADVIGPAPRQARVRPKWRKYYDRLVELRVHLLHQQVNLTQDAMAERPTFSTHMADAGTDTYDRDLALGVLSSEQDALYEIEEALDRIHNGTYGICELTGKPIEPERLEAIPWTRFSAGAEKELESQGGGALKRARLGQRETVTKEAPPSGPADEV